jgi:hypothetical protein
MEFYIERSHWGWYVKNQAGQHAVPVGYGENNSIPYYELALDFCAWLSNQDGLPSKDEALAFLAENLSPDEVILEAICKLYTLMQSEALDKDLRASLLGLAAQVDQVYHASEKISEIYRLNDQARQVAKNMGYRYDFGERVYVERK